MNFLAMQNEVIRRMEETDVPIRWTLEEMKDCINDGYQDLCIHSACYEVERQFPLDDSLYYNLHDEYKREEQFLNIVRIQNLTTGRWLDWESTDRLDVEYYYRWQTLEGEPQMIVARGPWTLGFFPRGNDENLLLKFAAVPDRMVQDTDVPVFSREFHLGCVEYANYELLCMDKQLKKAIPFWTRYLEIANALRFGKASGGQVEGGSRTRVLGGG
jgi:hypothetical protein